MRNGSLFRTRKVALGVNEVAAVARICNVCVKKLSRVAVASCLLFNVTNCATNSDDATLYLLRAKNKLSTTFLSAELRYTIVAD